MIKYNNNTIFDLNFGTSNVIKVYRNNAIVFYKVSGGSPTPEYKVCFAVVDDITQYQETEFEDVYDKATKKWYKLNNLNQYEEYGAYGNGRSVTTYKGKLTIDEGYEYEWNGSEWVNVGEITGTTATLPDVPFTVNYNAANYDSSTQTFAKTNGQLADTDVTITSGTLTAHDGYVTVASGSRGVISGYGDYFNRTNSTPNLTIISKQRTEGENCHMFANRISSSFNWMYRPYSNKLTLHGDWEQGDIAVTTQPVIESVRIDSNRLATYNNYTDNASSTKSNFSYSSSINGSVALFAGYTDISGEWFVGDFYWIYMSQTTLTDEQVQQVINYNESGGEKSEYPKYYSEKSEPLDDLTFNTMAESQTYAKANCVYDGMRATIDGDRYYFDSTNANGWVKILEYYKVEDVTPDGASGWTISGSSTYNPDSSYYDDFDIETTSSYATNIAKVTIYGYDHFTYYLRSFHGWSSSYGYAMATNLDEVSTPPSEMSYDSQSVITNTYEFDKSPKSAVNLSNYRRVTYNNLDKTVEHTFYVYFYGKTYIYGGNATILIPKEQTNENWEQVTFSASSNVASFYKKLYIDDSTSASGGTQYWYNRWIIGLQSGNHTSHTNFSYYNYCPNVTSSTFTSVAGEQRQVNFTYDDTTEKTLSFRLVDGSGNVLTPSDTVYYDMTLYNSCNASISPINLTLPMQLDVKVGGRFRFHNSSNRHYIYGYSPNISFDTDYYVDNYQDTFDIVYTKLSDEAVTITYTTYDPSDTEVPAFKTDITYPYNGGTTSSTTLTSFDVPYTYQYEVSQTNAKLSADRQSYTAGQTTRTINFVLYPNNREFSTVTDMEAYTYAWEGMNANVGDTRYKYKNGEWVEEAYTQYEYIQTQTGNYRYDFNTNFYPTTENTIEVKFTFTGDSIDWGRFICWSSCDGDSCDSTQFRFTTVTSSYAIIARKGNSGGIEFYDIGNGKTVTVVMPLSSTTYTYNTDSTNNTCNYNSGEFSLPSTTPMHIFNLGYASDNRYAANVRLHYVKVYDGSNNLVKHYVPSYNNGTPCLYNIVDGEYIMDTYTSSSHGTLTLGPEV